MTDQTLTEAGRGEPQSPAETDAWLKRLRATCEELIKGLHKRETERLGEQIDQLCERVRKLGGQE
jgi:hypothetical protein